MRNSRPLATRLLSCVLSSCAVIFKERQHIVHILLRHLPFDAFALVAMLLADLFLLRVRREIQEAENAVQIEEKLTFKASTIKFTK